MIVNFPTFDSFKINTREEKTAGGKAWAWPNYYLLGSNKMISVQETIHLSDRNSVFLCDIACYDTVVDEHTVQYSIRTFFFVECKISTNPRCQLMRHVGLLRFWLPQHKAQSLPHIFRWWEQWDDRVGLVWGVGSLDFLGRERVCWVGLKNGPFWTKSVILGKLSKNVVFLRHLIRTSEAAFGQILLR